MSTARGSDAEPIVPILTGVAYQTTRKEAIAELTSFLNCSEVIIFIRDEELGILLPAPGFPQTLPKGREWQAFLQACGQQGEYSCELVSPDTAERAVVQGHQAPDGSVLALLGGSPDYLRVERVLLMLPLLVPSLKSEQAALACMADANTARRDANEARALARSLDEVRLQLQNSIDLLMRQKTELARTNSDLQQFAYITSHDLQEPLRVITSFSQLIAKKYKGKLDVEADQFIDYISSACMRMKELIDSVLHYSSLVNAESAPVPLDFSNALQWALLNLETPIRASLAEVTSDPLPTLAADRVQIIQLFQNLIGNSLKYRSEAPPRIHLSAVRQGAEWLFSVQDNGMGFEPRYANQIFGVFKRLHTANIAGVGIGLAICKRVVEKHDGRIWVDSQPGKGSTFYFTMKANPPEITTSPD
ncbi:MAG TPA: ATP-binding protein [Bryobacteraceae bacterium]|nr:ATP-binding protein [Bryobacteraceae bacterium]